jgi:hypothetical protein
MIIARYLRLSDYRRSRCCPLLLIGRLVIVLIVLVVVAVFAVKGYPPEEITGLMLVLVAGVVSAADRLIGVGHVRAVTVLPPS